MIGFPDGFLWDAATAAHQMEGNNINSDFCVMAHVPGAIFVEPSGDACDHYRQVKESARYLGEIARSSSLPD